MKKMIVLFVLSLSVAALSGCGKKEKPTVDSVTSDATSIAKDAKATAADAVKDADVSLPKK